MSKVKGVTPLQTAWYEGRSGKKRRNFQGKTETQWTFDITFQEGHVENMPN